MPLVVGALTLKAAVAVAPGELPGIASYMQLSIVVMPTATWMMQPGQPFWLQTV